VQDLTVGLRSVSSVVEIVCADRQLASTLRFIEALPKMSPPPQRRIRIDTVALDEPFYDLDGDYRGYPGTPSHLLNRCHRIARDLMLEEASGMPILHAATIVANGRRFLMIADKRAGKTTLSLKCLAEGLQVEGDEHVVVRSADVLVRPRTLRIKQGSISCVPELAQRIRACPRISDWTGELIYSMPPETAETEWKIAPGQVDFLIFLSANHGGLTSTKRLSSRSAFERLLKQAYLPERARAGALARLHTLCTNSQLIEMRLGCLKTAISHLRHLSSQ
jgi:hypothetical protein